MKGIFAALLALIMGFTGFATEGGVIEAEEDEFIVQVWLDTDDAVCVLSHANMLDGELVGGGSACNADMRTPLSGYVYENFRGGGRPEGLLHFVLGERPLRRRFVDAGGGRDRHPGALGRGVQRDHRGRQRGRLYGLYRRVNQIRSAPQRGAPFRIDILPVLPN